MKVKTFMWLLIKNRLPLRERFSKFQMIPADQNLWFFGGNSDETFYHLFLHNNQVNVLWYQVAGIWEVPFVCPNNFLSIFNMWFHTDLSA